MPILANTTMVPYNINVARINEVTEEMPKAVQGSDEHKRTHYYKPGSESRAEEEMNEGHTKPIFVHTGLTKFEEFRKIFLSYGYKLKPLPGGDRTLCGWDIMVKSLPDGEAWAQLNIPGKKYMWKSISENPTEFKHIVFTLIPEVLVQMKREANIRDDKEGFEAVSRLQEWLLERTHGKSPLLDYAYSEVGNKSDDTSYEIGMNGEGDKFKMLPALDWFPKELRQFDPLTLLLLFPEAEATAFMLAIGKALFGNPNVDTIASGHNFTHGSRSIAFTLGHPKIGKTYFINELSRIMHECGFKSSAMKCDLANNYGGYSQFVEPHMAVLNDTSSHTMDGLLRKAAVDKLKMIGSGDKISVEEKFQKRKEVYPRATLFLMGNDIKVSSRLYGDKGMKDRLLVLKAYDRYEMGKIVGKKQQNMWLHLNETLPKMFNGKFSKDLYLLRFLRACADLFAETCGFEFKNGRYVKTKKGDYLQDRLDELREQFRSKDDFNHLEEFVEKAGNIALFTLALNKISLEDDLIIDNNYIRKSMPFSLLVATLKMQLSQSSIPKEFFVSKLDTECKLSLAVKQSMFDTLHTKSNVAKAFEVITSDMESDQGIGYPTRRHSYEGWANCLVNWQKTVETEAYKKKMKEIAKLPDIVSIVEPLAQFFRHQVSTQKRIVNL